MSEANLPIVEWMKKTHMPRVMAIEESNNAWEGWSEKDFTKNIREKHIIGMVSEIQGVVVAFAVYELKEKELFLMKFEVAKEITGKTKAEHVLLENIKAKASKMGRVVRMVMPENRESIPKYQFFAAEGFESRLKKKFFCEVDGDSNKIYNDGYEFSWKSGEKQVEDVEKQAKQSFNE